MSTVIDKNFQIKFERLTHGVMFPYHERYSNIDGDAFNRIVGLKYKIYDYYFKQDGYVLTAISLESFSQKIDKIGYNTNTISYERLKKDLMEFDLHPKIKDHFDVPLKKHEVYEI